MRSRSPGVARPLVGLAMVAIAGSALLFSIARGGPPAGAKPVAYASGILTTSTSGDGEAILSATPITPGHTAHGQVTVKNDSSSDGAVSISQRLRSESPGDGGGRLYDDLVLTIRQSDGNKDGLVYDGPISAMGPTSLSRFSGEENRTYSFTATMPDHGDPGAPLLGDNSLQDSATSVDFVWSANSLGHSGARRCRHGVLGTGGPDVLAAGRYGQRILGRAGNDRIRGGAARDCIYGGSGDDKLLGRAAADLLRGGFGNDVLRGGPGDDRLRGRQGDDVVIGGSGRDRLRGTSGNDLIESADGAPDRVRCGVGVDTAMADPIDRLTGCERVLYR
jgi:Ca2+-binding RTX toxin-like protein